jgi:hypothetical protein
MTSLTVYQWQVEHTHPAITLNLILSQCEKNLTLSPEEHSNLENILIKTIQIVNTLEWPFNDDCEPMDIDELPTTHK